ncbi:hypothetical protein JXQ70_01385 [bacterium]|nr:hypothetical protein [bacterium]
MLGLLVGSHFLFTIPRITEWTQVARSSDWQSSYRLRNLDRVAEILHRQTEEGAVILSMWPGYAYEAHRNVLYRWEMGVFNQAFLPYFSQEEAKKYHMAYNYNLPEIVREHKVDAVVCGIDAPLIDRRYLRSVQLPRYIIGDTEIFLVPDGTNSPQSN